MRDQKNSNLSDNITLKEAQTRARKLRKILDKARFAYHVLDKPIIDDAVNDSLKNELEELERKFPELKTPDSPTQRVGGEPLAKFKKLAHQKPMLSLDDAFSFDELQDWENRNKRFLKNKEKFSYFAEVKVDGFAVSLVYENGKLVYGATRGNGKIGEDVTLNLKTIESIPFVLRQESKYYRQVSRGRFEIRGEVYMSAVAFKKLNKERQKKDLPLFANPRNAAAGSIRQLDSRIAASRELDFFAYDIIGNLNINTHHETHQIAKDLGFKVIPFNRICENLNEVVNFKKFLDKKRKKLNYWIDGVVVLVDDLKTFQILGVAGKSPRGMIAYKFDPEEVTTILEDVVFNIGRTGMVNPVAILKPVLIAGTTVSRATLHNEDQIKKLDIKIGDTVVIVKAGDIIPKVLNNIKDLRPKNAREIIFPRTCPGCGGKLEKKGAYWYCQDKNCFVIKKRALGHFVSRGGFNIEGLGPQILTALMEQGLVKIPADLFDLRESDLEPLERFAQKSSANLVKSIQGKKKIDLGRFLYSLGIRHIGEQTAIDLANNFKTLERIKNASLDDLNRVENIGTIVAESVYEYFHDKNKLKDLGKLLKKVQIVENTVKKSKITGESFCITGSLDSMSRDQAKAKIRELGGQWRSDVTEDLSYLIVGREPGSKLAKAEKLIVSSHSGPAGEKSQPPHHPKRSIPSHSGLVSGSVPKIISEKEFLELIK
ncbi:MAG: NAD-dependent DNA ligase LigA [Patescibacteria group bacterium]|nr:NAD-dependent DNA ligase LigA [Patescibacteria group bacterium]